MTKKDYELIARVINRYARYRDIDEAVWLVNEFGDELIANNPDFNLKKFMDACYNV